MPRLFTYVTHKLQLHTLTLLAQCLERHMALLTSLVVIPSPTWDAANMLKVVILNTTPGIKTDVHCPSDV